MPDNVKPTKKKTTRKKTTKQVVAKETPVVKELGEVKPYPAPVVEETPAPASLPEEVMTFDTKDEAEEYLEENREAIESAPVVEEAPVIPTDGPELLETEISVEPEVPEEAPAPAEAATEEVAPEPDMISMTPAELTSMKELMKQSLLSEIAEDTPEPVEVKPTRGHQQKIFGNKGVKKDGSTVRTKFTSTAIKGARHGDDTLPQTDRRDVTTQGTVMVNGNVTKATQNKATS